MLREWELHAMGRQLFIHRLVDVIKYIPVVTKYAPSPHYQHNRTVIKILQSNLGCEIDFWQLVLKFLFLLFAPRLKLLTVLLVPVKQTLIPRHLLNLNLRR